MRKTGAIILNSSWLSDKVRLQAERLKTEFFKLGIGVEILFDRDIVVKVNPNSEAHLVGDFSFAVFLNKDYYLGKLLEKCSVRLYNKIEAIKTCDDKLTTYLSLLNFDIPMPKILSYPLVYSNQTLGEENRKSYLSKIISELGLPLVVKENFGSLGSQVSLIHSPEEAYLIDKELAHTPHLFQEYISCGNSDFRCIVIGKAFVTCIKRANSTDFRANIARGGRAEVYSIPEKLKKLCERIAAILDLDFCGIDVLLDKKGNYFICEVNSNCLFDGAEKATGINIAEIYAKYICKAQNLI